MPVNKLLISIVFFCCLLVSVYAPRATSQSDCANAEAAEDAIQNAWNQKYLTVEVIELLRQAEASAQPPECDITKAINLAEEATQLARSTVPEVRVPPRAVTTPTPESPENKARDFKLPGLFGIFWVLTISYAIYLGYRCVVSEDEERAARYSDKLAVVSLILLCACALVIFFWYDYRVNYDASEVWGFLWGYIAAAEAVVVGLLFAGIPGVTALVASKKAINPKGLATSVREASSVCFKIGLFGAVIILIL